MAVSRSLAEALVEAAVRIGHYQWRFLNAGGVVPLPPCPVHGPGGCWEPE